MDIWGDFGFRENPYSVHPVPANEEGERLLVGRTSELRKLRMYITSSKTHPTIEGANGVGKTSLVSIATYQLYKDFINGNARSLYIPVNPPFQIDPSDTVSQFKERFYLALAQTFIKYIETIRRFGFEAPDIKYLEKWINNPVFSQTSGGASLAGFGGSLAHTSTPNLSEGFSREGFIKTVQGWLENCFPESKGGGFVCVLDNLELLDTSKSARDLIEAMRDDVLNTTGVRWVLCGARGIIRSVASSPRFHGRLRDPMELGPILDENVGEVIDRRIKEYTLSECAFSPVDKKGFEHIYLIGNYNLRNALKYSEDFAFWIAENGEMSETHEDKFQLLEAWMASMAERYEQDTRGVRGRAWDVFDKICDLGGSTSPSEYMEFGFESYPAMRPHVKALEEAHLIESSVDDTDNRRKTINLTSRGWVVRYKRRGFSM